MSIQYEIVAGSLPDGMAFTDNGRLRGRVAGTRSPAWLSEPGTVGDFAQGATVSLSLLASPSDGATSVSYALFDTGRTGNSGLPTGVVLDSDTGLVSGVIGFPLNPQAQPFRDTEVPLWTDPVSSDLGTYDELTTFLDAVLSATPRNGTSVVYTVMNEATDSGLPPRLVLDPVTGVLSGIFGEVTDGPQEPAIPIPLWETSGLIAIQEIGSPINFQLSAIPQKGSMITAWEVIGNDVLPPGIFLDSETGIVSGTPTLSFFPINITPPSSPPQISSSSLLGTFARGQSIGTISISATPSTGRTVDAYTIQTDTHLPFGVILDRDTGRLTGTISSLQSTQITTFTVVVVDSAGASIARSFMIRIL